MTNNKKYYPWIVVALLWGVALLNYMDRQMLSTMKSAMMIDITELESATNFGRLMAVFLWIYGLMSPVAGMIADRINRKWLIVGSLFVWSFVTLMMGYSTDFNQIYILRAIMGVSEALYIPAGLSLITDYHQEKTRSLAVGIHMTGLYTGQALGGFGATIAGAYSWETTFHWFGIIGIAYSLVSCKCHYLWKSYFIITQSTKNIMRKIFLYFSLLLFMQTAFASDSLFVRKPQIPILIDRTDNILVEMRVQAHKGDVLNKLSLQFKEGIDLNDIKALRFFYSGTEATSRQGKHYRPVSYISSHAEGKTKAANPAYSIKQSEVTDIANVVTFTSNQPMVEGVNYYWISIEMKPEASLLTTFTVQMPMAEINNMPATIVWDGKSDVRRMGIGVRHAGDDGASAYRIPGLVTTNNGTLLGVYDIRYNSSVDLQEMVDIGVSRSTDKGQTWEPMRVAMTFGETGGLPHAQNGVGDPSILVDEKTNTIWIVAAWTHGMGNGRAWWNSMPGMSADSTAQLMLVKSEDDGKTWSQPINITPQVKDPSWYFLLQGPGRGITMKDGTLVFPIQFIDSTRIPNAGIMYSKDRGTTWHLHNLARTNTTEAQVAEIEPGVLMLNMRDNRGGSRAVATTRDLGKTWYEHPSSRSALQEPVCMASLIHVDAKDNITGKDLLIFSNPNTTKGRNHITIKVSTDGGMTWPLSNQVTLDEDESWGYSCLSMIDKETVGIFYESSVAHMTFQAVKLTDLVK